MRLGRRDGYGADDTLPSHIVLLRQSAYLGGTRRARPMLWTSIEIHEPERERLSWAGEGWSTVKLKKIKATVLESTGQLPRTRENLHELKKLVAVYDARRVGHRECPAENPYSPGLTATRPPELRGGAAALMG